MCEVVSSDVMILMLAETMIMSDSGMKIIPLMMTMPDNEMDTPRQF
jgi:hypothetical protein